MPVIRQCCALIVATFLLAIVGGQALAQSKSTPAAPKLTAPAAPTPTTTTTPQSGIGAPMTSQPSIAPLSPQIATTPLTGGSVRNDRLPGPTALATARASRPRARPAEAEERSKIAWAFGIADHT
jgi:hypothetical protein